jgi:hypothetical protein
MRNTSAFAACLVALLCARSLTAAPIPMVQVTNDLWDVSKGTVVTANSPSPTNISGILGFATGAQLAQDSYFSDGKPAGSNHFIEFKTTAPVTIRSLNVWGGDDRIAGAFGRRAFNEFRLFGWNGSAFVLLIDDPITVPYTQQGPNGSDGALIVHQDIPGGYTSDKWRAEFVQTPALNGTLFGPRVLEMDGFGTFVDGTTGPVPAAPLPPAILLGSLGAVTAIVARRWSR